MQGNDIAYLAPCEICGEPFGVRRNSVNRGRPNRFCSRTCWLVWHRRGLIERVCIQCGTLFTVPTARASAELCSQACHFKNMRMSAADRVLPRLVRETIERVAGLGPCWTWPGTKNNQTGYGYIKIREDGSRKNIDTHRIAWEAASGQPIPDGLSVLHVCDVRLCARYDTPGTYEVSGVPLPRLGHLFLGTQIDNMADAAQKGRIVQGVRR